MRLVNTFPGFSRGRRALCAVFVCSSALGCAPAKAPPLAPLPNGCDPAAFAPPVCDDPSDERIQGILAGCGGSICHGGDAPQANLLLTPPSADVSIKALLDDYVNMPSWWDACSHRRLIDTSAIDCSFLFEKVATTPECGDRMPTALPPLAEADSECLRAWLHLNYGQ